jgi:hypothetical protein
MEISKIYLVVVVTILFLSHVRSDRLTSYNIKRLVPSGPNSAQSPDPVPVVAKSNDYNFIHVIKRQVPTGPNPAQSPDPPVKARPIKRQVPTGPNPAQSPDPPVMARPVDYNFIREIKRQVPTGPNPAQSPDPVPPVEP